MKMSERTDFALFILTHGRANNVRTAKMLQRMGYTGRWYVVVDNEDEQADEYIKLYGDRVVIFDKAKIAKETDSGDNLAHRRSVLYARNFSFELARQLGVRYFMQLDDDYNSVRIRINRRCEAISLSLGGPEFERALSSLLEWYESAPITSLAMAQGGDFIGGPVARLHLGTIRKAMNTFLCCVDRPFKFCSRLNDDVTTVLEGGRRGRLFLTIRPIMVDQASTQQQNGGLTEIYLEMGTYTKSFYSVMYQPSCVKIGILRDHGADNPHPRVHHAIDWRKAVPMILRESWRKPDR